MEKRDGEGGTARNGALLQPRGFMCPVRRATVYDAYREYLRSADCVLESALRAAYATFGGMLIQSRRRRLIRELSEETTCRRVAHGLERSGVDTCERTVVAMQRLASCVSTSPTSWCAADLDRIRTIAVDIVDTCGLEISQHAYYALVNLVHLSSVDQSYCW